MWCCEICFDFFTPDFIFKACAPAVEFIAILRKVPEQFQSHLLAVDEQLQIVVRTCTNMHDEVTRLRQDVKALGVSVQAAATPARSLSRPGDFLSELVDADELMRAAWAHFGGRSVRTPPHLILLGRPFGLSPLEALAVLAIGRREI